MNTPTNTKTQDTMNNITTAADLEAAPATKSSPREYEVRSSAVRRFDADKPVSEVTVIPSIGGFPGASDEVTLQPGQWLEIVRHGSPESWSKAVVRP